MENKSGWKMIDDIKDLPTMSVIYFKVNQMLQTGEASIKNVASLIEMDPALSSKVLRLVNCAFYGFRSQISSIPHAVMILGFNTVKNAIVTVSILDVLTIKEKFHNFNVNDFWSHSVGVAVLSKQLAERSRLVTPEDAFTAGLLHDMGKIIMLKYFQEDLATILQTSQEDKSSFYDAELKVSSIGHVLIGAYLAKKWQFPDSIIESIACHHMRTKKSGISGMVPCIILADALSNSQYQINPDDFIFAEEVEKIIKPIVINIKSWLPEAQAEIDMACEFFLKGRA